MWRRYVFAVLAASGCYRSPSHPGQPAARAKPACSPTVKIQIEPEGATTTAQALLDGTDLKLDVDHEDGKTDGEALVYPYTAHSVLFSWTAHGRYGRPNGGSTLYEVDCVAKTATPFFKGGNADFGHSELTGDGKTIYFSAIGGLQALDLATKKTRQVTPRVELTVCGDRPDSVDEHGDPVPRIALAAVRKLAEDDTVLIYEDGDGCGLEGDWEGVTMYLDDPDKPGGTPYPPRPVSAVEVDAGGSVWASTSGGCADVALWKSTDRGDHWKRVALPKPESRDADQGASDSEGGPYVILADARRAGFVMIATSRCFGPGFSVVRRLLVTRDGGAKWDALELPWSNDAAVSEAEIALEGGTLDHPIAWGHDREDPEKTVAWRWKQESDDPEDSSMLWELIEEPPARPKHASDRARLRDEVFEVSPHGLLRHRGNEKPTKLFPQ
jgi:hypothetical protein